MRRSLKSSRSGFIRHRRMRSALTLSALTLTAPLALLAVPAAVPTAAPAATAAFKIAPHIANHTPVANRNWPVVLAVTRGSARLSGSVRYEFLFAGQVVSRQPGKRFSSGLYKDELQFPLSAVGEPLTLRILVKTRYGTEHVDWSVDTKR